MGVGKGEPSREVGQAAENGSDLSKDTGVMAVPWSGASEGKVSAEPQGPRAPSPKALSPVRTQCLSCSPVPPGRPIASLKECGLWPDSGQKDGLG